MKTILLPEYSGTPESLPFGGVRADGHRLGVNSKYLTLDGTPWFPVSGEFHYARYRREDWERELCKMKAGGISVIATYVFWIHHEEEEDVWDFSGNRDLRYFISMCKKLGLMIILRIGPWCHGECRNGGFPDWIRFQNKFRTRCDDPTYLFYVRRFYGKIFEQAEELLWKDNGPVIGIQLENEYRAYANPDRKERKAHMHTLRKMAEACGFIVPLYTATTWGTATLNEMETLPVLGGYADAAWARTTDELPESAHFLFQPPMNDQSIGCDLKTDDGNYAFDVDINRYPYLTAELGGGMQVTLLRRVVIAAKDTEAITVCMIGSGSVMLGYYMYHGGTNPDGRFSTMEESAAVGAPNTLPVKSYDFQAMIRENGELHESYHLTRRHHMLLQTFGWLLAPAVTVIPEDSAGDPADLHTLRYAVRHNPEVGGGFILVNNHLRRRRLDDHMDVVFRLRAAGEIIQLPPVDIRDGDTLILPYRLPLGDSLLEFSNATPLCALGKRWFFYTDAEPIYRFAGAPAEIVTLTEKQSRMAYLLGEHLYLADCALYEKDGKTVAEYEQDTEVTVWSQVGKPQKLLLHAEHLHGDCRISQISENLWRADLTYPESDAESILQIDYAGDRIEVYNAENPDVLIADWFTTGLPFRLSAGQYGNPKALLLRIPASEEKRYFDLPTPAGCTLNDIRMSFRFCQEIC